MLPAVALEGVKQGLKPTRNVRKDKCWDVIVAGHANTQEWCGECAG